MKVTYENNNLIIETRKLKVKINEMNQPENGLCISADSKQIKYTTAHNRKNQQTTHIFLETSKNTKEADG